MNKRLAFILWLKKIEYSDGIHISFVNLQWAVFSGENPWKVSSEYSSSFSWKFSLPKQITFLLGWLELYGLGFSFSVVFPSENIEIHGSSMHTAERTQKREYLFNKTNQFSCKRKLKVRLFEYLFVFKFNIYSIFKEKS